MEDRWAGAMESLSSPIRCCQLTIIPALPVTVMRPPPPTSTRTSTPATTHVSNRCEGLSRIFCHIFTFYLCQPFVLPMETIPVNFTIYEDLAPTADQTPKSYDAIKDIQDDGYYFGGASSSVDHYEDYSVTSQTRPIYDYALPLVFEPLVNHLI